MTVPVTQTCRSPDAGLTHPGMIRFDREVLEAYLENDVTLARLEQIAQAGDQAFTSHRWLVDSAPKRLIFHHMYGDLLAGTLQPGVRVLDVGGGYTALTRVMVEGCAYHLLDIMTHDPHDRVRDLESALGRRFWIDQDWHAYAWDDAVDLVIANDIFPNVDQRLVEFVQLSLSRCRELRLLVTYYNTPRWYRVKRMEGDEVFHMMAWDGAAVRRALEPFTDRVTAPCWDRLEENVPSLYDNGRQVCLIELRGDRME